ncbi:MAG: DUF169 domain-containing protein [Thermoleophilia bacterium]
MVIPAANRVVVDYDVGQFHTSMSLKAEGFPDGIRAGGADATAPLPAVETSSASPGATGWPAAAEVQAAAAELSRHVDNLLAPSAWRFVDSPPDDSVFPSRKHWTCLFAFTKHIQSGRPLVFSAGAAGCPGACFYLGLGELPLLSATLYLAGLERLKKDLDLARAFYQEVQPVVDRGARLVHQRLDCMPGDEPVEVVNLWVGADSLSKLLTLANYDRATNDNVIMPFASGCQSIWTLPYKEKQARLPRAVAGSLDPTVRKYLPLGTMSFTIPANRFVEMCGNIDSSFLGRS